MFRRRKILLIGDSITQLSYSPDQTGWANYLSHIYQRRADVYNRGFSGYNTDMFLKYVATEEGYKDVFCVSQKDNQGLLFLTVCFGANDACDPKEAPQHVPLHRFASNLHKILSLCRKYYGQNTRIIIISPPPVHHEQRLKYQLQRYGEHATGKLERTLELSGKYAIVTERVSQKENYPFVNLWKRMQFDADINCMKEKKTWHRFLCDGLHLSREGNIFVGSLLNETIATYYPEIQVIPCKITGNYGCLGSHAGREFGKQGKSGFWHDELDNDQMGSKCSHSHDELA